jgi:hypothetical protein
MPKLQMLAELRRLLRESFTLQHEGGSYAKLARAQGNADGYMRALLDAGHATPKELLALVAEERTSVRGPATRPIELQVA